MKYDFKLILLILFAFSPFKVKSQTTDHDKSAIKTDSIKNDIWKTQYAMGNMLGQNLARLKLSEEEIAIINLGLRDAASNNSLKIDTSLYKNKIKELFSSRLDQLLKVEKDLGRKYVAKFKRQKGVIETESGLVYKVLIQGSGDSPDERDTVEIHYHGTLIDGTVFDSSVDRDRKISFPLNRVIKGWTEGIQTMKVGGKSIFIVNSDIGHGDAGSSKIPGGATLIYTIELFDIKKYEE